MSQKDLADRLKIATTTLNRYIKERHEPDYMTLKAIATNFDVATDYLLEFIPSNMFNKNNIFLVKKYNSFGEYQKELMMGRQVNCFLK